MTNMFASRDSRLNAFLFSEVGVEANGTGLTILSLLARLGKDPWDEAAAWAGKPKDAAIRLLTESISQMPPNQQAFDDAHLTASRLIKLLPTPEVSSGAVGIRPVLAAIPKRSLWALLYLFMFLVSNILLGPAPKPLAADAPAPPPVAAPMK